jgi:glycosyltransferase involved in cell wall biosynthesis
MGHYLPTATFIRVNGATYFRSKNRAIQEAKGEALVFADSDVVYSKEWLESMLRCLENGKDLVSGNTQYEKGPFSTTLTLCDWSARRSSSGPTDWFYGNNVAIRRSLFEKIRFREDLGISGGGAVNILREQLKSIGVQPWFCAEAKAWHHLAPFWQKRLRVGGYQIQYRRLARETDWSWLARVPLLAPFLVTGGTLVKAYQRAWRLRSTLPWRGFSLPFYGLSMAGVKAVECIGACFVAWSPGWVSRRFGWFDVPNSTDTSPDLA